MAGWRQVLKAIAEAGGSATLREIYKAGVWADKEVHRPLRHLVLWGLAERQDLGNPETRHPGKVGPFRWTLTPLGWRVVEGWATVHSRWGGASIEATWIAPLRPPQERPEVTTQVLVASV